MNNQEYHISYLVEKNIPLPEAEETNYPFDKMEIGDSFFIPLLEWVLLGYYNEPILPISLLHNESYPQFGFWNSVKKDGLPESHEYKVRPAIQNGHNGCRVWRIK